MDIDQIIEGKLFLSGYTAAGDENALKVFEIKGVVNLSDYENPFPSKYRYLRINIEDDPKENLEKYFDQAIKFIDKVDGNVLVNCSGGVSRSPSVVMSYLMKKRGMCLKDAFYHTLGKRGCIWPNDGFIEQLIRYERKLVKKKVLDKKKVVRFTLDDFNVFKIRKLLGKKKSEMLHDEDILKVLVEEGGNWSKSLGILRKSVSSSTK